LTSIAGGTGLPAMGLIFMTVSFALQF
jgi:hypothetical protein